MFVIAGTVQLRWNSRSSVVSLTWTKQLAGWSASA